MLALEPVILARLKTALGTGWACFGHSVTAGQRDSFPLASVMFTDARVEDSKTGAVNIGPAWRVTLVARKGQGAAALLDTAFAAAIASLHNWAPGLAAGRAWNRLTLGAVTAPVFADDGLTGLELTFTTHARYDGQDF